MLATEGRAEPSPETYRERDELERRREWAGVHSARIAAMLEAPTTKEVPGRVWRARLFLDEDYTVVTLVQNIKGLPNQPGQMAPKVSTFVNRGYHRASITGGAVVRQDLYGEYHTDELVAFLRLDTVDPDTFTWTDETKYSSVIVVRDIMAGMRRND